MPNGVQVTIDRTAEVLRGIAILAGTRVMVGIPSDQAGRKDGEPINNAALGYIHENGAPEVGIPARPFLVPGVAAIQGEIEDGMRKAGDAALSGRPELVMRYLHAVGLKAQAAVRRKITTGPFVPLKPETIARRRKRSPGSKYRRKATTAADVKPLIDTGQLRNAINYVIRQTVKNLIYRK